MKKHFLKFRLVLALVLLLVHFAAGTSEALVHPSVISTQAQLDAMRTHILTEPNSVAAAGWSALLARPYASLSYVHSPQTVVDVVPSGIGPSELAWRNDGHAARSHALQWVVTGNTAHRDKALAILNDWADTFTGLTSSSSSQPQLESAWALPVWLSAADILRYYDDGNGGSGWSQSKIDNFDNNYASVLYAEAYKCRTRNNNWGVTACLAMMAYGAWTDDVAVFEEGLSQQLNRLEVISQPDGEIYETCRDPWHPQYSVISWTDSAEMAHNLGYDDLYTATFDGQTTPRLAIILEYFANMMLGYTSHPCGSWGYDYVGQYKKFDNYEVPYQHYVNELGVTYLPVFQEMVEDYWRYDTGMDEHFLTLSRMTHGDGTFYGTSPQRAVVIYDFESPAYTLGDSVESGEIVDDGGNQVLRSGGANKNSSLGLSTPISQTADGIILKLDAKWTSTANVGVGLSELSPSSADRWDEMGPYLTKTGYRDGLASTSYDLSIPGLESFDATVWNTYTLALYNTTETYNVYINGILAVSGAGYRDPGTNEDLKSFHIQSSVNNPAGENVYVDNILVVSVDLTSDGFVDIYDMAELGRSWQTGYDWGTLRTMSEKWLQ